MLHSRPSNPKFLTTPAIALVFRAAKFRSLHELPFKIYPPLRSDIV
ncbi:MAG: hypothetical protein V7K68_22550 [Nostoc sp.]